MTLDELIAIHEQGPAIVYVASADLISVLKRLQVAEIQVDAYRKQEAYAAARINRQKAVMAAAPNKENLA